MPITTTPSERIGRCTRMRRFIVEFNRPESFVHTRSSAAFTIITSGFEFSVHTAPRTEVISHYSITSSARARSVAGTSRAWRLSRLRPNRIGWPSSRTYVTWVWNPAGIPCGLPWVCRRSALLARPNLNRRHQAGSRSFPSPSSSISFHQRFPKSLSTMSYNSSPVFRSRARSIGRPRSQQPPIQQKWLPPFDKSLRSPASEKTFSRIQSKTFHHGAGSIDGGAHSDRKSL